MQTNFQKHYLAPIAGVLLASTGVIAGSLYSPAQAFNKDFSGGTANFSDFSTGGSLLLYSAINKTGKPVNDLHLSISYLDAEGNAITSLNRSYDNPHFEDIPGVGSEENRTYTINPGLFPGFVVYDNSALGLAGIEDPEPNRVRLSGNWTFDNDPVQPVPGPLPILGLAAAFGFSRKLRKRIKLHRGTSAVSTPPGA